MRRGKAGGLPISGFVSTPDAARLLGIADRTLLRWVKAGLEPSWREGAGVGATFGWDLIDVAAIEAAHAFHPNIRSLAAVEKLIVALRAWPVESLDDVIIVERESPGALYEVRGGARQAIEANELGGRCYLFAVALLRLKTATGGRLDIDRARRGMLAQVPSPEDTRQIPLPLIRAAA